MLVKLLWKSRPAGSLAWSRMLAVKIEVDRTESYLGFGIDRM